MRFDLEGDLHSILGPLIYIRNGLVYLVHQSAKDYLMVMDPITSEKISARSNESNLHISTCCLAYLSFDEFEQGPVRDSISWTGIRGRYKEFPFFEYSAMHWPSHVRQLDEESFATPDLLSVFLNLATSNKKFHSWHRVYRKSNWSVWEYTHPWQITTHFGFIRFLQALLDNWAAINDGLKTDESLLLMAIFDGNKTAVRYLVEHGADVNADGGKYGNPLEAAIIENHVEIVRCLVENGADVNAQDGKYGNPLQAAVIKNRVDIVRCLVEHGADVNAQSCFYKNPLQVAVTGNSAEIVRCLVEHGADVNTQCGFNENPLQAAVTENNTEIVRYLVENGADVNAQCGCLPGQLKSLFKILDTIKKYVHRLTLVKMLQVEGPGLLKADSSLLRVGLRNVTVPGNDKWVVSVSAITGMAHLISAAEEGIWMVNSRIDLETFNDVY
jgi:hypothetical protein